VKNTSDKTARVFVVTAVNGKTYTVQRENTTEAEITYQEHELEKAI